jgi:hypothetical protein
MMMMTNGEGEYVLRKVKNKPVAMLLYNTKNTIWYWQQPQVDLNI